ncbi:SDR family oxidoreductase [Paenibacillus sp. SI8]|uniref:SDR family oxidoreductase n=1 Tax=unclassified Paenibacillus TaxID=185978 RepID=UPI0034662840
MNNTSKAHVIFGTGPLGMAVMRELKMRGVQDIRIVNRSGKLSGDNKGVYVIQGDASQESISKDICKDASVVYHCAQPGYLNWPTQFPALTRGILEGAAAAGAKLIYADNLYMYGQVHTPLNENLPHKAQGKKGITRAKMAEEVMKAHQTGKVRAAIGRASDYYGPGVLQSFMGERVFGFALKGKPVDVLGNLDMPHTYTYIDDFARGLATLGLEDRAVGEVWHMPSAETITTRQLLQLLFHELGKDCKVTASSRGIVSILSLFHPMMREIKEILYEFEQPFIVDHSKFVREFGNFATTSHKEAIKNTVNWYRNMVKKEAER